MSRSKAEDFDLSLDRRPGTAVDSSAKAPKTSSTPSKKALMATAKRLRSATSRDLNARASPAPHPASPWGINGIGRSARLPSRAPQLAAIPDGAPEEAEEDPFEDEAGVFIGCPIEGRFAPRAARPEEDAAVEIAAGGWVPRKAARVTVRRAAAVTPEDLARLSLACPDLRALSLRHARNLSAEDWKSLTGVFPRLRSIGCEGAAQLSKDALAGLVVSKVAAIEALDISRCPALDESSFSALAACTALRILRADHNAWVTNAAVATLSDTAPQLSSLSLRGCERITAAGLPSVAKLRRLAELDLSGIPFRGGAGAVLPILQPLTALSSLALSPVRDAPPSISPHDPPVRGDLAEFWASSHLRRIVSKDVVEESATGVSGWDGATWPLGKEHGVEAIVPLQKVRAVEVEATC